MLFAPNDTVPGRFLLDHCALMEYADLDAELAAGQTVGSSRMEPTEISPGIIQNLMAGKYIDPTDVKNGFQYVHFRDVVLGYCGRYGIK